jgi:hypothetical protein
MSENSPGGAQDSLTGSGDVPPEAGVPSAARQHRAAVPRRRPPRPPRMRPLAATAAVVVAAGGVTAVLVAASGSHAPTALATVTGALSKTAAQSYAFRLHTTVSALAGRARLIEVSGALDPARGLGTEVLTTRSGRHPARMRIRFIGRYVYTSLSPASGPGALGRPWDKTPAAGGRPPQSPGSFVSDLPVSPAEFSGVLRSAGQVQDEGPASGPGWTGTRYAFTARIAGQPESASTGFPSGLEKVSGTVYLDQQGRVRRLVTIATRGKLVTHRDLTCSNFGAPMQVTAPPASQVKDTSAPYWGFYF